MPPRRRRTGAPSVGQPIAAPRLPRRLHATVPRLPERSDLSPSAPLPVNAPGLVAALPSVAALRSWLEAAGCVTCIGALSLLYAVVHTLGEHPLALILYAVRASAVAPLAVVGTGRDAVAIMLHPLSWAVGLGIILLEIFYYQTLAYVPPAHGKLMLRPAVPIAMVAGWACATRLRQAARRCRRRLTPAACRACRQAGQCLRVSNEVRRVRCTLDSIAP